MKRQNYLLSVSFIFLLFASHVNGTDYTISGTVRSNLAGNPPIENVTMTASNSGGTTQTQADGSYSLLLPSGWSGTITPSKSDYQFDPVNRSYTALAGNIDSQDFEGQRIFELSGYVYTSIDSPYIAFPTDFTVPVVGVEVCAGDPNGWYNQTITDNSGFYSFHYAEPWSGGVNVGAVWVNLLSCVIDPDPLFVYEIWTDFYNANFDVCITCCGIIEDGVGSPIDGVSVTAVSNSGKTAVFISGNGGIGSGLYQFGLSYDFSGTVTPSMPGLVFTPSNRSYTNIKANQWNQDFTGATMSDLYCDPTSLAISQTTVMVGNTLNFSGVIENQGAGSSGVSFQVNLFICTYPDVLEFGSSYFLGSFMVSPLGPGSTSSFNETVTIPVSTTPGTYYAWVSIDPNNTVTESDETNNQQSCSTPLVVNATGIIAENIQIIAHFDIRQNVPNPFNPGTRIQYQLPKTSHVLLGIYNLMGQELIRLVDEVKDTGIYSVEWDGRNSEEVYLPSGIYIYQIKAGEFTESKKLILSR